MEVVLMVEGQEGVTWKQWLALAQAAENSGLAGLFRSDHYASVVEGRRESALEAWATLAALAAVTTSIRLGTLVSPVTFRHPSELAKLVATVDHVSAGRVELGLGTGHVPREHTAYGFHFPELSRRFDLLEEQIAVVHGSWTTENFSFEGQHYRLEECEALPKPLQEPRPPIILGGNAKRRSLALAGRFADEYNVYLTSLDDLREKKQRVATAAEGAGRQPGSLRFSTMVSCVIGADAKALRKVAALAFDRWAELFSAWIPFDSPESMLAAFAGNWLIGTPDEALTRLRQIADIGVDRVYLQHLAHEDLATVHVAGELAAALTG